LKMFGTDLRMGSVSTRGCSGSPSIGWIYEYSVDEAWTHHRYFEAIGAAIAIETATAAETVKHGSVEDESAGRSEAEVSPND
jgi:hypothetical protein